MGRSIDGLVMVLLGGVQTLFGPIVGASLFTWLEDTVARETDYWRAMLGGVILVLVLVFPAGVVGTLRNLFSRAVPSSKEIDILRGICHKMARPNGARAHSERIKK